MEAIRIGPHRFATRQGTIYEYEWDDGLKVPPALMASPDDSLVAFERLQEEAVANMRARLFENTKIAELLHATNFDPPSDHITGFDYGWVDALINDFRGINDDLDTPDGVRGDHFTTLLKWQPKVDPAKTALLALVGPDGRGGFAYRKSTAVEPLALALSSHGYDAVVLSTYDDGEAEFEALIKFADRLHGCSPLPVLLACSSIVTNCDASFCMQMQRVRVGAFWARNAGGSD